jgi:hypothetical protein
MSYEGINHKLCANGHYSTADAMTEMYESRVSVCYVCAAEIAHEFAQDQTNGEDVGNPRTLPPNLEAFVKAKAKGETCNLGHFHVTEPERFNVPDDGLWKAVK